MDLYPLLYSLADGNFHSGETLGKNIGVTRTAIWKQANALKALGVELHSVTGKGYRLPEPMSLLSKEQILAATQIDRTRLEKYFDLHLSVGSTNIEAMKKAQAGYPQYLVMAEHQSQGRGRRGRTWVSPLGKNLYFSLMWSFQNGISALEGLSLLTALIVVRALKRVGCTGSLGLKWPNDVLLNGNKLAGILLEINGDMAGPCQVVIGIGLNINMPQSAAAAIDQPYADLADSAVMLNRNSIAAALIDGLLIELEKFAASGFAPYRQEWESLDVYHSREVQIQSGASIIEGTVAGVDAGGALLLNTSSGIKAISGGEVFPTLRPL
jgi:BirA family transcriptional regulator, biotin operon repressor / biotin---[acetyl-CoA-carboxylase] ligase